MVLLGLPYIESSIGSHSGLAGPRSNWHVCGSVSWSRGRMPAIRCVLVSPDQHAARCSPRPLLPSSAGSAGAGSAAGGSTAGWLVRTKQLAAAAMQTHRVWSTQSLQTLQRVGSMIRSTSLECLAALGTTAAAKKAAGAQQEQEQQQRAAPQPPAPNGGDDDGDEDARQIRASLSRFLTSASRAEVSQAAMLSDLSNLAYDVNQLTPELLQREHGLTLITHSRSGNPAQQPVVAAPPLADTLRRSSSSPQLQQTDLGHQSALQAIWPVPVVLLQPGGSGMPAPASTSASMASPFAAASGAFGSSNVPASPRTPVMLGSFAEGDDVVEQHHQLVTASGVVPEQGSPRRQSSAAAAAAPRTIAAPSSPSTSGGLPAAFAAADMPPAAAALPFTLQMPPSGDLELQQHLDGHDVAQHTLQEQVLLQQLRQQEALVLLEMEANRQLLLRLQQQHHHHLEAADHDLRQNGALSAASILQPAQNSLAAMAAAAAATAGGSSQPLGELPLLDAMMGAASVAAAAAVAEAASAQDEQGQEAAGAQPPADFFVCDGPLSSSDATPTRFFVIQGSITFQHWVINLTIDPCEFEGGALGSIKVHRGVYEAALDMYDVLLPHVEQHLAANPDGKVAFTGHSLGGSLATLLMLLYVHRGVLPAASVATVRTFGSPAIFCEGATGSPPTAGACQSCSLPCEHRKAHLAAAARSGGRGGSSAADGLLAKLGLPADAVVNVVMTRDIVPRAFVCDYTLVAGVLRNWMPSFKEHNGLAACKQHKALYNFVGSVEVLQPTQDCDFVLPDEGHFMLPPDAALYKLTEPTCPLPGTAPAPAPTAGPAAATTAAPAGGSAPLRAARGSFGSLSSLAGLSSNMSALSSTFAELTTGFSLTSRRSSRGGSSGGRGMVAVSAGATEAFAAAAGAEAQAAAVSPSAAMAVQASGDASLFVPAGTAAVEDGNLTLGDAILTFMNSPHPLQTLGELRAYGPNGAISRYHNPTSYTKALQRLNRL